MSTQAAFVTAFLGAMGILCAAACFVAWLAKKHPDGRDTHDSNP
jgi:hypothetical protein